MAGPPEACEITTEVAEVAEKETKNSIDGQLLTSSFKLLCDLCG